MGELSLRRMGTAYTKFTRTFSIGPNAVISIPELVGKANGIITANARGVVIVITGTTANLYSDVSSSFHITLNYNSANGTITNPTSDNVMGALSFTGFSW